MDEPEVGEGFLYDTTFSLGLWTEELQDGGAGSDEAPLMVTVAKSERHAEVLTVEDKENSFPKEDDLKRPAVGSEGEYDEGEYISLGLGGEGETAPAAVVPEQPEDEDERPAKPVAITGKRGIPAPWTRAEKRRKRIHSPFLQLHQDIVDFNDFVSPTEAEKVSRAAAIQRVTSVVQSIWPTAEVALFGSFATGLYLPTSDCDMVVLHSGVQVPVQGLKALAKGLTRKSLVKNLQVIGKARVPIVKFVETESNIAFDISFDVANGPQAAVLIKKAIERWPPLKPLCMVLKIFLQQRELNEVYSGGIGSYALLTMLIAHLQLHPSWREPQRDRVPRLESNLGILLVDFFELYGRLLNMRDVGVSCRNGGTFYSKRAEGKVDAQRPYLLSIEDPQDRTNDICKNSFNISKVRAAFMHALRLLTTVEPEGAASDCDGMLARIIRVDKVLSQRSLAHQKATAPIPDVPAGTSGSARAAGVAEDSEREDGEWEEEEEEVGGIKDTRARPPKRKKNPKKKEEGAKGKGKRPNDKRQKKDVGMKKRKREERGQRMKKKLRIGWVV